MRRSIVGILALCALLLGTAGLMAVAGPASAHPGVEDPYLPVGQPSTVVLGIPSEEPAPLVAVDVGLPAALVFPGYRVGAVPVQAAAHPGGPSGRSVLTWSARVVVVAGALAVAGLAHCRRRRRRPGRPIPPVPTTTGPAQSEPI